MKGKSHLIARHLGATSALSLLNNLKLGTLILLVSTRRCAVYNKDNRETQVVLLVSGQ